ncbi:MAG: TonB family protein [Acidobacteriota bacterium]
MATLNHILAQRQHRLAGSQKRRDLAISAAGHTALVALFFLLPKLWAEEPPPFELMPLQVVPPKALGIEQPPPPEPRQKQAPAAEPEPEPPKPEPPKPEPPKPERTVLVEKKKPEPPKPKPPPPKPRAEPPPTRPDPAPASPVAAPLPKRQGSPFGNPLGASTSQATLGVEDPNFTYGYYLDLIVGRVSSEWRRPAVGGEALNVRLFFRIEKDGTVNELAVQKTSGDRRFDEAALAAVRKAAPLPPLPKGYKREFLGINLTVK